MARKGKNIKPPNKRESFWGYDNLQSPKVTFLNKLRFQFAFLTLKSPGKPHLTHTIGIKK